MKKVPDESEILRHIREINAMATRLSSVFYQDDVKQADIDKMNIKLLKMKSEFLLNEMRNTGEVERFKKLKTAVDRANKTIENLSRKINECQ